MRQQPKDSALSGNYAGNQFFITSKFELIKYKTPVIVGKLELKGNALIKLTDKIKSIESLENREEKDKWLIPGVVCKTRTLIYGQASSGKSMVIASIIASLKDGRDFMTISPLIKGLKPLVVCADAEGEFEYKERLNNISVTEGVDFLPEVGLMQEEQWLELAKVTKEKKYDYVVFDHSTGMITGDEKERLPWVKFWEGVRKLGVPVIVVAHSSDSAYQGLVSHRPMGNSAVTQFSRCEVEIFRKGNAKFNDACLRQLRSSSRYGRGVDFEFRIADPGCIEEVTDANSRDKKSQNRTANKKEKNKRIIELAVNSAGKNATEVAREIHKEVDLSIGTVRNRLQTFRDSNQIVEVKNSKGGKYSLPK